MNAFRTAYVYIRDDFAGILSETDSGYRFAYDERYLQSSKPTPVSLTLPLRNEPYESSVLFPFFDGLIPEEWLLHVVTHNWKVDAKDRLGLLLIACKDSIGNVSILEKKI